MQNMPEFNVNPDSDIRIEQRPKEVNKPPIGVAPGEIVINRRIHDLASAIIRNADKDGIVNYAVIELWAKEIELHCKTIKGLLGGGKQKDDG